jgi:hypothetical protein
MRSRGLYTPPVTPRKPARREGAGPTPRSRGEAGDERRVGDWGEVVTRSPYGNVRLDHLLSRETAPRPPPGGGPRGPGFQVEPGISTGARSKLATGRVCPGPPARIASGQTHASFHSSAVTVRPVFPVFRGESEGAVCDGPFSLPADSPFAPFALLAPPAPLAPARFQQNSQAGRAIARPGGRGRKAVSARSEESPHSTEQGSG